MSGWLRGKAARIIGSHATIEAALTAAGARIVTDGPVDCLVHIAPPPVAKLAHELSHAEWRATLDSGLDSRFHATAAFAAECRERGVGGSVLYVGAPEQALGADQAAAAGALANLTKTLGVEWARDGIRVNAILTSADNGSLGNLAAYLLSDYAAYVTGAVMGVTLGEGNRD